MATIKKVLILGIGGMLGSTVYAYFSTNSSFEVAGTTRNKSDIYANDLLFEFDASKEIEFQLDNIIKNFCPDFVLNCIGIINKYCRNDDPEGIKRAIRINSLFPYALSDYFFKKLPSKKIIQIATDCVFSGKEGNYIEKSPHDSLDVYGKTKSLGEVIADNFLNIRCSIIGFEKKNKSSLLEWFLNHSADEKITGFSHHKWNGVTTLQFAEFCADIIIKNQFEELRKQFYTIHYCPNKTVSKFELLQIFQQVFGTNFIIEDATSSVHSKNMTLKSEFLNISKKDMIKSILEYKLFIENLNEKWK